MAGAKVNVTVDLSKALGAMDSAAAGDALELLTLTIEEDMRPYVKHDTGQLEDSAALNSDFRGGRIVYTATRDGKEYAGYAYEDPNVAVTDPNPRATARWAEHAAEDRGAEWARILADALREEMA